MVDSNSVLAVLDSLGEKTMAPLRRALEEPCECYECVGPEFVYAKNGRHIQNNLKLHTFLGACKTCGRPKTEYRDLGRKGYYECWWCRHRAGGPGVDQAVFP